MKPELLYAGFDTLDVSFMGALPPETLDALRAAKNEATKGNSKVLTTIGPGTVEMHVLGHGGRGGYAFVTDTGPLGEGWAFKDNPSPAEWNIATSVRASALATYGYYETKARLVERLEAMGCLVGQKNIRHADFAMDFAMPADLALELKQFVAHGHCKVNPYWSEEQATVTVSRAPSAVFRGRRLESVTIGKMPGRQIIVYDKRRAAIEKQTPIWFKVWGIDREDRSRSIWRVEVRAGKSELKDRWRITTFDDFERAIGDAYRYAVEKVRYLADGQTDSNVSRQLLHPLWSAATETLERYLLDFRAGLTPDQVREVERQQAIDTYVGLVAGNTAGLGVALALENAEILALLPDPVRSRLSACSSDWVGQFRRRIDRASQKLRFIRGPNSLDPT